MAAIEKAGEGSLIERATPYEPHNHKHLLAALQPNRKSSSTPSSSSFSVPLPLTSAVNVENEAADPSNVHTPPSLMLSLRILRLLPYVAGISTLFILATFIYSGNFDSTLHLVPWLSYGPGEPAPQEPIPDPKEDPHPIVELLHTADTEFKTLLSKETFGLSTAAHRYREKRGRHPPPGFDKWWKYARDNNATIVEEFWDQIYHDLTPLWALDTKEMLQDVRAQPRLFKLRAGKVTHQSDHFWMPIWQDLINSVAKDLPDMDLAMNSMDEPRLLIAWETMKDYVAVERKERKVAPVDNVTAVYTEFKEAGEVPPPEYHWDSSQPIWPRAAKVCPPDSEARLAPLQTNFSAPPNLTTTYMLPHLHEGYVSNYTLSTSICHQPDLQGLHGFFIEPISTSTGDKLFPMFGSSKLTVNSEILVPPTMYYKGDERFTSEAAPVPWAEKSDSMVWRGLASGGRNKESNWRGFHRHRLVSMLNGTQAIAMPNNSNFVDIQNLPLDLWHLASLDESITHKPKNEAIGQWLKSWTDVGLNDLACFPREAPPPNGLTCYYTNYLFHPSSHVTLVEQHHHKYLVDVDGNSFSGRYRDFLSSGSLPIKATLFREWHDSRLVAWKHFVPLDNRFLDIYGIMEFFLGYGESDGFGRGFNSTSIPGKKEGRDWAAKKIALEGRDWARKVLRVEDMRVYMYRLLLEYARVMDEKREVLGWVDDLRPGWRDGGEK